MFGDYNTTGLCAKVFLYLTMSLTPSLLNISTFNQSNLYSTKHVLFCTSIEGSTRCIDSGNTI